MLTRCFLDFSVGVRASVIGMSQISSFFSCYHLILNALSMPLNEFDVNVANGIANDVACGVLPV